MNNTLKTIQILHKIGKVLSKIAFVCSIVGAACCLLGILCLACGVEAAFQLGGITIHSIIEKETAMTTGQLLSALAAALILSAANIPLAWFAGRYFKHELAAGTPFTIAGAREMKRLGILTIVIPIGSFLIAAIVNGILSAVLSATWELQAGQGGTVTLGVMFLILSVILKYGAEREASGGGAGHQR